MAPVVAQPGANVVAVVYEVNEIPRLANPAASILDNRSHLLRRIPEW